MALKAAIVVIGLPRVACAFPTSRFVYARGPGAEQCPDRDVIRTEVTTRLGYDPFFPSSDKTIVLRIARAANKLKGELELIDDHGVELGLREFEAEPGQCEQLVHALALSISIAIDPKSAETYEKGPADEPAPEADAGAGEPAPALPPVSAPPTAPVIARARPLKPPRLVDWSLGAGIGGEFGGTPTPTPGGFGFFAARVDSWSLAIEGQLDLPVSKQFGDVRLHTTRFAFSALPCFHVGIAFLCEETLLGGLRASGTGSNARSGTSVVFGVGARIGSELRVAGSFGLIARANLLANPWPISARSEGRTLWRSPIFSGGLAIDAAYHF